MADSEHGLVFAFALDRSGGGRQLDMEGVRSWRKGDGMLWAHLDYSREGARDWLLNESGLDEVVSESLMEDETRPRSLAHERGLLLILRGVNLNPGADPEDMISVRMWLDEDRIITMRRRKVLAIEKLRDDVTAGTGPAGPGEFVAVLSDGLVDQMATIMSDIDDEVDELEDEVLTAESYELRPRIANIRRKAISIRRYLAPQREVLARIQTERIDWIRDVDRARIREVADRNTRYIEDLDSARERASVTHEELDGRLAEKMNRTMYMLSLVATVILPLSFITGLLGINVGGIPGTDDPLAFWLVCLGLVALLVLEVYLFKRKRWL